MTIAKIKRLISVVHDLVINWGFETVFMDNPYNGEDKSMLSID